MPQEVYFQKVIRDPTTGQEHFEYDLLRGTTGSGAVLVPPGGADTTVLTVPSGYIFVMTSYKVTTIGIGVAGITQIYNGPSAGADLRVYAETIVGSIAPVMQSNIQSKPFSSDVVATHNGLAGAYVEVGGYLLKVDVDP